MTVYIVCEKREQDVIKDVIKDNFKDFLVEFIQAESVPLKLSDSIVVVSKNVILDFRGICVGEKIENLYVFYSNRIFQVSDDEKLVEKRSQMISSQNWDMAKRINGVLVAIDFLLHREDSKGMPDYLQIETTSYCNAKCVMCSHYFSNNKDACHLSNNTLNNMEDAIQLSSTISLNGMGEPFMSPEVCNQIDYYRQFGNRIVTNTNLSILDDRIIAQINSCFDWLEISIDGASPKLYEAVRKNLKYDTLKANLTRLKQECPNVRKHIAMVVMRQNVHEMPALVELAYEAGANIITFMTLNANIIIQNSADEMSNYPKVLEYYSVKALEVGKRLGIPVIVPNAITLNYDIKFDDIVDELDVMNSTEKFKTEEQEKEMYKVANIVDEYLQENDEIQYDTVPSKVKCRGICDWILKQSYIDLHGNVAMCCRNQSFHMGNVNKTGCFENVWTGEFYKKLRRIFYSGYIPESCLKCGLIESGNLHHLIVDTDDKFYAEPQYKNRQKKVLLELLMKESE